MYCLDANVWIYFFDATLPEHDAVFEEVAPVVRSKPIHSPTVLQMEVIHYLNNRLSDAERAIERFLDVEDVQRADLTGDDVTRATDFLREFDQVGIGGRDATVLSAMERHDVRRLWTHDEALQRMGDRLDWLDVTDPVTQ